METTLSQPPMATARQQISTPRRVGLVMTYNQKETCVEAISSLLAQTLALDLIIVSDDCSTDGTYELIADYFSKNGKPSNVDLYKSEKNLGFIPHFNTLLKRHCRDIDLIFYNAGDDISEANRVEEFYREYVTQGKPRYFLGHSYVTSFGSGTEEILVPPIESIKDNRELCLIASAYHIGASQVFTGALFFDFGPILFDDCYEDLTLGYRALLKNAYYFIPKALLRYRVGGLSSWQKNPLEKKRGRLKSTLTQRAVDSMRSGDFDALTTIQDCYSQYGFSHLPHQSMARIVVVSDEPLDSRLYSYSISDHFPLVSNICEVRQRTSLSILESADSWRKNHNELPDLVWVVASRVSSPHLLDLLERAASLKELKLAVDLGLTSSLEAIFSSHNTTAPPERFIGKCSNVSIHTANIHLYNDLLRNPAYSSISYLPPLQDVDGPDPIVSHSGERRGIVVIVGTDAHAEKNLSIFQEAYETSKLGIARPDIFRIRAAIPSTKIDNKNYAEQRPILLEGELDILKYDYLVILSRSPLEDVSSIHYWWASGARYCLPVFVSSDAAQVSELIHGNNCLLVNNNVDAWTAAFDIIRSKTDSLQAIASNARRDVYFKFSVQKRVNQIGELISYCSASGHKFDKFLPL